MGRLTITGKKGYTLIEMLTVMAIMAIIMTIAVAAFYDWGRSAGMRGSLMNVHSGLGLARQYAITHRIRTQFAYGNVQDPGSSSMRGYYLVTNAVDGIIGNTNYLADGVGFEDDDLQSVTFKLDGSCPGPTPVSIRLLETERRGAIGFSNMVDVVPLTGRAIIISEE